MGSVAFTDSFLFVYIILPILIFSSRILDQSFGTIRIIFVSKGMKYFAPLLGFLEVLLWLIIMKLIFENINNYFYYIAYAAGFGAGNFVGMLLEEKLAVGLVQVRVIPQKDSSKLLENLKIGGYRFTSVKGQGAEGPVDVIYSIIKRKSVNDLLAIVREFNPNAFFTIEEIKYVSDTTNDGYFDQDVFNLKRMYRHFTKKK